MDIIQLKIVEVVQEEKELLDKVEDVKFDKEVEVVLDKDEDEQRIAEIASLHRTIDDINDQIARYEARKRCLPEPAQEAVAAADSCRRWRGSCCRGRFQRPRVKN